MSIKNRSIKETSGWEVEVFPKTIDQKEIDYLNKKISLKALLSKYKIILEEKYSPSGWTHKGTCPFPSHQDSTPSFNYNSKEDRFFCFGCSKSGRAVQFISYIEGITFQNAIAKLASSLGSLEDLKVEVQDLYDDRIDDELLNFSNFIREKLKQNPKKVNFIESCTWVLDVYLESTISNKTISYEKLLARINRIKNKIEFNLGNKK